MSVEVSFLSLESLQCFAHVYTEVRQIIMASLFCLFKKTFASLSRYRKKPLAAVANQIAGKLKNINRHAQIKKRCFFLQKSDTTECSASIHLVGYSACSHGAV